MGVPIARIQTLEPSPRWYWYSPSAGSPEERAARERVLVAVHPPPVRVETPATPVGRHVGRVDDGVAEDALDLRVAGDDAPRRRFRDDDAHRHGPEHGLEPRLALAQALLRFAPHVDVDHRADEAEERAVGGEARPARSMAQR
jgi:hypothetical protein